MTKHEFAEYVKSHKKEIALGAACMLGTGVLIALGAKSYHSAKNTGNPVKLMGQNLVDGFTTGEVNMRYGMMMATATQSSIVLRSKIWALSEKT